MPFESGAQYIYMKIHHPEIWKRWKEKYGVSEKVREELSHIAKRKGKHD